ncbi:putative alpha/beta hydrolase domain-containing protein 14B [Apostichopus japonicus]|uniref:Protein ABHD14A n=2 Tax=Stichopus japonicus TaxID=307972 RepID=A0A2G8KXK4_STIJA|nr:putative alpha/beta hydrolase domain-containing protein 14B [Apostichopus japonicus]
MEPWTDIKAKLFADPVLSVKEDTVNYKGHPIHYRQGVSSTVDQVRGTLLFLHGQSFKSQTWHDLGTLHFMANAGYNAVAIDLPGYGKTESFSYGGQAPFLLGVKEALGLKDTPVIIISPSMSGGFSIPLLFSNPEAFKGYLPVAPVNTASHTHKEYSAVKIPTCIVYGENDKGLGVASFRDLSNIPNKQVHVLSGAGHAAYMNSPGEFHQILLNFSEKLFS